MMTKLLLSLPILFMVACASDVTPQQQVYALQRDFEEALTELEFYAGLPECTDELLTACHDPEVLDDLIDTAEDIDLTLDEAEALVRDPTTPSTTVEAYISVARATLARLTSILIREGVLNAD